MTPPQLHISLELLSSVGMLPSKIVGEPTTHGAVVTGMHGIRSGLRALPQWQTQRWDWPATYIPNGGMFTIGLLSMMLAAGVVASTLFASEPRASTARLRSCTSSAHPYNTELPR